MATSPWLATWQDAQVLLAQGVTILDPITGGSVSHPVRSGVDIARELCGRMLLRYITPVQLRSGMFRSGSVDATFVTPTAYAVEDLASWLLLPGAHQRRTHVLVLDPAQIPQVQGPFWVALGRGIQYILPFGFPESAIVVPGAPTGRSRFDRMLKCCH